MGGCRLLGCDTPYVKQTADQPIARYGESEEVTKLLLSLAADATFSTGSEWVIDGGAVLGPVVPLPEE